jgi:hypothetical protein
MSVFMLQQPASQTRPKECPRSGGNSSPMSAPQPVTSWSRPVIVLALVLAAATAWGGWRAAMTSTDRHDPRTIHIGGATYTVTHVEQVTGLADVDLGGMTHGIQGLVSESQLMVQVSLTVSSGDSAASYQPQVLQAFPVGKSQGVSPAGGSLPPGKLPPNTRIEGKLSYLVPRDGATLALRAVDGSEEVPLLQVSNGTGPTSTPHTDHTAPAGTK